MSEEALDALRSAFVEVLVADRRVRGREGRHPGELSMAHFRLLSFLLDEDHLPAGRLAAAADLSPASTTQALDLLERRGLVRRERDAHDRRIVVASLTDEGREQTQRRREVFRGLWQEALGDLSVEELAAGKEVLERIAVFLGDLSARKAAAAEAEPVAR